MYVRTAATATTRAAKWPSFHESNEQTGHVLLPSVQCNAYSRYSPRPCSHPFVGFQGYLVLGHPSIATDKRRARLGHKQHSVHNACSSTSIPSTMLYAYHHTPAHCHCIAAAACCGLPDGMQRRPPLTDTNLLNAASPRCPTWWTSSAAGRSGQLVWRDIAARCVEFLR